MKFVVDAHLPPDLCALLQRAGHDAIHTSSLAGRNRTPDEILNELSLREHRVVVTKIAALEQNSLVELDRQKVRVIV